MAAASITHRALLQDTYLQDLVLSIYRVYTRRMTDGAAREILEAYLKAEAYRGRLIADRIAAGVEAGGASAAAPLRALFAGAGRVYGMATSLLGTRRMLRIILSASERASRRACAAVGAPAPPEAQFLATLKARNEGELADTLRQHLIDTRRRRD